MIRWHTCIAGGVLALCLTACSQPLSWPDQTNGSAPGAIPLNETTTIGQTFVALESGLNGVDVFLAPQDAHHGDVQLTLQPAPQTDGAGVLLATANLPAAVVTAPGFYHFAFSPQPDSRQRSYYARLVYRSGGTLLVGHGPPNAYLQGALYRNDRPDDDAQLAFRLRYDPMLVGLGVARQALTWLGWLGLAALLFAVPGWALLAWLWPKSSDLSWGEQLGLAVGLGLAVYPILFLLTGLVGLRLKWWYAALPVVCGVLALALWLSRRWHSVQPTWRRPDLCGPHLAPDLAFVAMAVLVFFTRFWVARGLLAPLWGDSYQHTVITQLMIDNGGLFNSWLPYADLHTFTYHFGFHTLAAVMHWSGGLAAPVAVLMTGQILNGLAVLVLYPLAVRISNQRWAGVGAVLVAGLLSPMPMAYVNWGRYTQLTGQAILPAAVVLAWTYFEDRPSVNCGLLGLAWIAWGGLALTHYRILIFAVLFAAVYCLVAVVERRGQAQLLRAVWLGLGAAAIFLPWFIHTFAGRITLKFARQLSTPAGDTSVFTQQYNSSGDLTSYLPVALWLLMGLALAWGLWRRERAILVLGAWWGLLLLGTNPQWLKLPGEGAISNFALLIAAYLPAGVLIGAALGWLRDASSVGRRLDYALLAVLMVVAVWAGRQRCYDLNIRDAALVAAPDVRAAAWIAGNTPQDARFLVNSIPAFGGSTVVGSDGGWWLPLLAHRATNVPPLNYAFEQGPRPDYRLWTNALPAEIKSKGIEHPDVLNELATRGLTYVYLGQLRGKVNNPDDPLLSADQLVMSPRYEMVYHQDRVWVFKVVS